MTDRLKQLRNIVTKTGDSLVLLSENNEGDVVMLPLDEYEYLVDLAYGSSQYNSCLEEDALFEDESKEEHDSKESEEYTFVQEHRAFTPEVSVDDVNNDIGSWRESRLEAEIKEISEQMHEEQRIEGELLARKKKTNEQEYEIRVIPQEMLEEEPKNTDEDYIYETPIPSMPLRWEMTKKTYQQVPKRLEQDSQAYEFSVPEHPAADDPEHIFHDEPI